MPETTGSGICSRIFRASEEENVVPETSTKAWARSVRRWSTAGSTLIFALPGKRLELVFERVENNLWHTGGIPKPICLNFGRFKGSVRLTNLVQCTLDRIRPPNTLFKDS
jgi:hypothetical protein